MGSALEAEIDTEVSVAEVKFPRFGGHPNTRENGGPSGQDEDYSDYNENSEEVRPGIGPGGQFPGPGMRPGIGPGRPGGPGQRPNPGRRTFQNENANYNYPAYLSK